MHASFVAIGAYTSFILDVKFDVVPWIGMLAAMLISLAVSLVVGLVSFKHRGVFFSLVTIGFTEIVRILLIYFKDVTGGSNGLYITWRGSNFEKLTFNSDTPFFYILMVVTAVYFSLHGALKTHAWDTI